MTMVNIYLPLVLAPEHDFHANGIPAQSLFGHTVRLHSTENYRSLEILDVPASDGPQFLDSLRYLLPWAAMRLDFGIKTDARPLQYAERAMFDGHAPTAYPTSVSARPYWTTMSKCIEHPLTVLTTHGGSRRD